MSDSIIQIHALVKRATVETKNKTVTKRIYFLFVESVETELMYLYSIIIIQQQLSHKQYSYYYIQKLFVIVKLP